MKKSIALLTGMTLLTAMNLPAVDQEDKELDHECTSWMIFSDFTGNNTHILHKNRDASSRNIVVLKSEPGSPRKWIGLGNPGHLCMGINANGLAAVMNSGEICSEPPNIKGKKGTPAILRAVLDSSDTAAQAVAKLQDILKQGDYSHGEKGSIFFFLDKKEGFICEITAKFCSVQRYAAGYAFRANIWHNPGMEQRSRNTVKRFMDSCGRESAVRVFFNGVLDKKNKIGLADILELSRLTKTPEDCPMKRSVCFKNTNSAATLVLHREFPDVLSTAYVLIGHPRHTLYLPIPICVEKLDPYMAEPVCSAAAFKRFAELGLEAPIPAEWSAFEKESMKQYGKASAEALTLLRQGKKAQAVQLLNNTAAEIWKKAYPLAVQPYTENQK